MGRGRAAASQAGGGSPDAPAPERGALSVFAFLYENVNFQSHGEGASVFLSLNVRTAESGPVPRSRNPAGQLPRPVLFARDVDSWETKTLPAESRFWRCPMRKGL